MSAVNAGKRRRRRWWLLAIVVIVVAAAVAGGVWWFFGRSTTATVHYLTATASTGTISQTVSSDFTLASDGGVSSISLSGSSSSSSSASSGTGTSATGAVTGSTGSTAASAVYAAFAAQTSSPSPSPSPTRSVEPTTTPTPSPTPTGSGFPTPAPSQSGSVAPSGQNGGSSTGLGSTGMASSSGGTGAATTSTTVSSGISGVVTHLFAKEGSAPRTLQRLLTVSGKGMFAFVSPTPLWKNLSSGLSSGEQMVNVAALQRALKQGGYFAGKTSGKFTSATKSAYKRWQADNGMSKTGVVNVDRFVWMPIGSTLASWSVTLGSRVSGGTQLASISAPSGLTAQALVSQSDLGELKVGQKAQMTIDGYTDQAFTGVITSISNEPASSSGATGSSTSSGSTEYTITIRPEGLPDVARSGMTGTLEIVLQQHVDVLLVPTSAVTGTSSTSYVRVMQDGTPVVRQVETGMATSSTTEITSGLAAGEVVVTGTYTEGATSTGTSSSTRSGGLSGGILGGSGGPPAGMPVPQGGFPGAQSGGGQ